METTSMMPASVARERIDYLFNARCKNLLVSVEKKIKESIENIYDNVEITNEEYKYCGAALEELGYDIVTEDGKHFISW